MNKTPRTADRVNRCRLVKKNDAPRKKHTEESTAACLNPMVVDYVSKEALVVVCIAELVTDRKALHPGAKHNPHHSR